MYEVEVKVPADHDEVRVRLGATDAMSSGIVAQSDTYFDAPHRDFAATDEALRVRRVGTAADGFDRDADSTAEHDAGRGVGALVDDVLGDDAETDVASQVTYKGPLVEADSKTREEFETGVENDGDFREILGRLGFEPAATVRKLRERYRVDEFTVLLDAVEDLGEYVEVETTVESESEVAAARDEAHALLRSLGLEPGDQIRTSYLGLLLEDA